MKYAVQWRKNGQWLRGIDREGCARWTDEAIERSLYDAEEAERLRTLVWSKDLVKLVPVQLS